MHSYFSALPISVLRSLDTEAYKFYDITYRLYDAALLTRVGRKPSETDPIKSQIPSKTSRGEKGQHKDINKDITKRQPGEQLFPIQVVTG